MSEPEAASAGPPERLRPRRPKTPVLPGQHPGSVEAPPHHRRLPGATPRRRPRPAPIRPSHRRHPSCARVSLRRDSCRHRRPRPSSPGRLGRCPRCTPPRQPLPGLRRCGAESRARRGSPPSLSKTIPSMNSFDLPPARLRYVSDQAAFGHGRAALGPGGLSRARTDGITPVGCASGPRVS